MRVATTGSGIFTVTVIIPVFLSIAAPILSLKSFKFTWTAPAKSRKFSMAPISTSVKSNSEINFEKFRKVFGNILPETTSKIEETMAIIMIPIVGGSFKNRMLI